MRDISEIDIENRMLRDNPWWADESALIGFEGLPQRGYFRPFFAMVTQQIARRTVVLIGPRRVGKTVMAMQAISRLLRQGVPPQRIFFAALDAPIYSGIVLEKLILTYLDKFADENGQIYVFFDEVQYLENWGQHLKDLTDHYPHIRFVVTGSAAGSISQHSAESGAGRFSDFYLPPLLFSEFLTFSEPKLYDECSGNQYLLPGMDYPLELLSRLNRAFADYIAFGSYPELAYQKQARSSSDQFIKNDVVDKVLMKDIPALYGISDLRQLQRLFSILLYNTGGEVSLEKLEPRMGMSKATIDKYLDYLEAAFLIRRLYKTDINAKRFKRVTNFKVYATNPALYSAMFTPPDMDDPQFGHLAETAVFAQTFGSDKEWRYARWDGGEVDLIGQSIDQQRPISAIEIKWSNRIERKPSVAANLAAFAKKHDGIGQPILTTRTLAGHIHYQSIRIELVPTALYCFRTAVQEIDALNNKVASLMEKVPEPSLPF